MEKVNELDERMGKIIEEVHNKSLTRSSFPCNPAGEDEWQKYRKKRRNEFIQLIKQAVYESLEDCDQYDYKADEMPGPTRKSQFILVEDIRSKLNIK